MTNLPKKREKNYIVLEGGNLMAGKNTNKEIKSKDNT